MTESKIEKLTTAQMLSRFHDEMVAEKFLSEEVTTAIYEHVLPALLARDGLIVQGSAAAAPAPGTDTP